MSSIADKSAARRAKILARSKDRMATVSGGVTNTNNTTQTTTTTTTTEEEALSREAAAAELERALDAIDAGEVQLTAKPAAAATADSAPAAAPRPAPAPINVVADPHEFLSAADATEFSPPPSPSADSQLAAFSPFGGFAAMAAARKRKREAEQLDIAPPPVVSPITAWKNRLIGHAKKTAPVRAITVCLVMVIGVLAGLGQVDGGLVWLVTIEALAVAIGYGMEIATKKKSPTAAASTKPTKATPPPPPSNDDPDVIDLDTDNYRTAGPPALDPSDPFAAFGMPGMGLGGMGGMQLPAGMDTGLKTLQAFMKYAAIMKQLMNDAMIFVFVCVTVNAMWQLTLGDERIQYE